MRVTFCRTFAVLALFVLVPLLGTGRAEENPKARYTYDSAGRLVRVDYADGKGLLYRHEYAYDAAGNVLEKRTTTGKVWHVAVKKPAPAAWILTVWSDGSVAGFGAASGLGPIRVAGNLVLAEKTATGKLDLEDETTGGALATFVLAKCKVKRDKKTGNPTKLGLKSGKDGPSGALKATATPLAAGGPAFTGTFGSAKNRAKVGKESLAVGEVVFAADGARIATSVLTGGVTGTLVRDPKGKAYGTITLKGVTYSVTSKLKDGATKVKAKSVKGAPVKFVLTLRQ